MVCFVAMAPRCVLSGILGAGLLCALAAGCREPTEIVVTISTSAPCSALRSGVAVTVGPDAVTTEGRVATHFVAAIAHSCASDGSVGTLVVTPGGRTAAIVVVGGYNGHDPSECTPANGYKGCIVARRSLTFVEHAGLRVPIDLAPACVNRPCDPLSTCQNGRCVSAEVVCADGACAGLGSPIDPVDGGAADATLGASDAGDATAAEAAADGASEGVPPSDPGCTLGKGGPMALLAFASDGAPPRYCIDRTEVTQKQYDEFLNSPQPGNKFGGCPNKDLLRPADTQNSCDPTSFAPDSSADLPVVCVDVCDAETYCQWAGEKHVCTPDEWRVACQSGNQVNAYTYGNDYKPNRCNAAGYTTPSHSVAVGSLPLCGPATGTRIYDLTGNVWEWTSPAREARGGGFRSGDDLTLRCNYEGGVGVPFSNDVGFRCCKHLD